MPETLVIAVFVFGAVLLLIALLGGKFKIFGAEVSGTVGRAGRIIAGCLGGVLIIFGLYSIGITQKGDGPPPPPPSGDCEELQNQLVERQMNLENARVDFEHIREAAAHGDPDAEKLLPLRQEKVERLEEEVGRLEDRRNEACGGG